MQVSQATSSVSAQESLVLVRNMMRTSVSTIAYLRNIFPEDSFMDKSMSGVNLKGLLPNSEDTRMVIDWLEKGVFDALQKQYLRLLSLVILKEEDGEIIENYDFKVKYPSSSGGPELSVQAGGTGAPQTKEEIARSMKLMLRKLVTLTQSMADLPESRVVTMKIIYDPSTPDDYEPPYFKAASEAARKQFKYTEKHVLDLQMGTVSTEYHVLDMRFKAPQNWLESSAGASGSQSPVESTRRASEARDEERDTQQTERKRDREARDTDVHTPHRLPSVFDSQCHTQSQSLYGDEPKVSDIERPLKQQRSRF